MVFILILSNLRGAQYNKYGYSDLDIQLQLIVWRIYV